MDWAFLHELTGGDAEFEQELLQTYRDSAGELVLRLQEALERGDCTMAVTAAHTLKGSSRSIGANTFASFCETVEHACSRGDLDEGRDAAGPLAQSFQFLQIQLSQALQRYAA